MKNQMLIFGVIISALLFLSSCGNTNNSEKIKSSDNELGKDQNEKQSGTDKSDSLIGKRFNAYKSDKNMIYFVSSNEVLDFYSMKIFKYTKNNNIITIENGKYYDRENDKFILYNNNLLFEIRAAEDDEKEKGVLSYGFAWLLVY
jgi:hypothetical protein